MSGVGVGGYLPVGLAGYRLVLQGFALASHADNGIFASTHAHRIIFP